MENNFPKQKLLLHAFQIKRSFWSEKKPFFFLMKLRIVYLNHHANSTFASQ